MTVTGTFSTLFTGSTTGALARFVPPGQRPVAAAACGRRSVRR